MTKKEIIAITGSLGSGKSSASDLVAEKLGFKRFSSGDFFRKIGLDLGISINEINKRAETDPVIDEMTNEEVKKVGNMSKVVVDSRTAFYLIPEAFKVYLDLSPEIAKERILNNLRENTLRKQSEGASTSAEIYQKITHRLESERRIYKKLYGVEDIDKRKFDLVIDTDKNNLAQVVDIIINNYKAWIAK